MVYRTLYSSFGLLFITPTVYGIIMFFEALYIDRLAWVLILLGGYLKSYFSSLPFDVVAQILALTVGMQLFHSQHTYPSSVRKQENTHFSNGMLGCSFL